MSKSGIERAMSLLQRGEVHGAESELRAALEREPRQPDALHLLGVCRLQQGDAERALALLDEAIASYDRSPALDSGLVNAQFNRGVALGELRRHEEAIESYRRVLALQPTHVAALVNAGNALHSLGRHEDAIASYERALSVQPNLAVALTNRGAALLALGRPLEALAEQQRALLLEPRHPLALNNHGMALAALARHEEAVASYERALGLNPDLAEAWFNRGNSLYSLKRYAEAAASHARGLALAPQHSYGLGYFAYALAHACDWKDYGALRVRLLECVRAGKPCIVPFAFLNFSSDPADQLACARACIEDKYRAAPHPLSGGVRQQRDRIRVAYVSGQFHEHALAYLMAGLFELHDRARFEVTAISFGPPSQGPMRQRLVKGFDRFVDVREKSDDQAAGLLRELEIDIAVDLTGLTEGSRLGILTRRPAPVQVSYLGYPGTLGASHIDYLIADRIVVPPSEHARYSEKIVYMPDSYYVNDSKRAVAERVPARREESLPEDAFIFCCFNNSYKITPEVFDVWMRLLARVPGSVLWLLLANHDVRRNLRREAENRGVDADRIVFAPLVEATVHLARHRLADLFLDTLPYNAHTTACDALWAGVPVLTCAGTTFVGRVASSILHAVGLPELVTATLEEYEALAARLATDRTALGALKDKLASNRNRTPLFDTDRWRRHVESAYATMWRLHLAGERPRAFAVERIGQD